MTNYIQVITTVPNKKIAEKIAEKLLEKKLAGCVQVTDSIQSTYWWQGKIESAQEFLCIIKTRDDLYEEVESEILEIHPYEVPEILSFSIELGLKNYFSWLDENLIF